MSTILVTFATLTQASGDCRSTAARIQSQLDDLRTGVQRIAQTWEGQAQQNYQAKQARWDRSAAELNQVLHQIAAALDQASQHYAATEHRNAAMWG